MEAVTKQQVGKRLADLRRRAGFTQAQVAEKLGIAPETMSRLERGQQWTDFETFSALAKLYGVEWADLMAVTPGAKGGKKAVLQEVVDLLRPASKAQLEMVRELAKVVVSRG